MILILKILSVVIYVILAIVLTVYLYYASRYRSCIRQRANDPHCYTTWKCGDGSNPTDAIRAQFSQEGCTLQDYQNDIDTCRTSGGVFDQCVACSLSDRLTRCARADPWGSGQLQTQYATAYQGLIAACPLTTEQLENGQG